jgi:hypothetical protein
MYPDMQCCQGRVCSQATRAQQHSALHSIALPPPVLTSVGAQKPSRNQHPDHCAMLASARLAQPDLPSPELLFTITAEATSYVRGKLD